MKKISVAEAATAVALVIVLAAAVALINQPSQASSGTLAIVGTDPAVASSGVSGATMSYTSVYAHQAGYSMASGWTQVSGSGTMDLMASQGTAQTLAASKVSASSYDAFRFNVDTCKVVYQGVTYTATVASTTVTAQSQSKVNVNASSSAAAVVDFRTFIENTASASNPQFVFSATAVATTVPPQTTASLSLQLGTVVDLSSHEWFSAFLSQTSTNLNVQGTISASSMNLALQNSGGSSAEVQEIIVTPVSATSLVSATLPASLSGSAVFTVSSSGTVQQASSLQASALLNQGATVSSGGSASLDYSGSLASNLGTQFTGIVPGEQYVVTCIGANTYASTTVVAT